MTEVSNRRWIFDDTGTCPDQCLQLEQAPPPRLPNFATYLAQLALLTSSLRFSKMLLNV